MVSFPPCKINLGLNVGRKRADGFHEITTCFYPVPWTDALEIVPSKDFSFSVSGHSIPGAAADNLCVRAYEMLKKDFKLKSASIHLLKIVPIGAGLGGGSADGAYTLILLNEVFGLSLSLQDLKTYAARLGSDCAFFIENKPQFGAGRGEILSDANVSLGGKYLVILKPEVHISTAEAFAGVTSQPPKADIRTVIETRPMSEWKNLLTNDFEAHVFPRFPVIDALHKKLYAHGAVYASMSGSGSAVYGIFDSPVELQKEFESVRYWSGALE